MAIMYHPSSLPCGGKRPSCSLRTSQSPVAPWQKLSLCDRHFVLVEAAVVGLQWVWSSGHNNVFDLVLGLREPLAGVDHVGIVCHQLLHLQGHTSYLLGRWAALDQRAALGCPTWCRCPPVGPLSPSASTLGGVGKRKLPPLWEVRVKRRCPPLLWPPL